MNNKVLITGAKGFLARNLSNYLSKKGYIVYGIGHGKWKNKDYKKFGYTKFLSGSISKKNLFSVGRNVDYVIHCAGKSIGYEPLRDFDKNSLSTYILLDFLSNLKKRPKIIFTSTISVGVTSSKKSLKENNTLHPFSHYGLNKKISESICIFYAEKFKLDILILRISSLFGIGLKKQFIYDAIKKVLKSQKVFWGTGKEVRDFIHIEDVSEIILRFIKLNYKGLNIFNCGSGNLYSTNQLIKIIQKNLGKKYPIIYNNYGKNRNPKYLIPNISKLTKKINFRSKRDFNEDIINNILWVKKKKTKKL